MTLVTNSIALSIRTPVGFPLESRRISPPGGDKVLVVMPASSSALVLAQPAWPSILSSQIGLLGTSSSRIFEFGNFLSGQRT